MSQTVSNNWSRRCLVWAKAQHLAFGAIKVLLLSTVTAFSDRSCPYQSRAIRASRKRVSDWGETGGRGRVCKTDFQHSKDEWSSVGTSAIKERDVLKSRAVCRRCDRARSCRAGDATLRERITINNTVPFIHPSSSPVQSAAAAPEAAQWKPASLRPAPQRSHGAQIRLLRLRKVAGLSVFEINKGLALL